MNASLNREPSSPFTASFCSSPLTKRLNLPSKSKIMPMTPPITIDMVAISGFWPLSMPLMPI
jgi:hypothetical protein